MEGLGGGLNSHQGSPQARPSGPQKKGLDLAASEHGAQGPHTPALGADSSTSQRLPPAPSPHPLTL